MMSSSYETDMNITIMLFIFLLFSSSFNLRSSS